MFLLTGTELRFTAFDYAKTRSSFELRHFKIWAGYKIQPNFDRCAVFRTVHRARHHFVAVCDLFNDLEGVCVCAVQTWLDRPPPRLRSQHVLRVALHGCS